MKAKISYTRRALPQQSKQVPPPRLGGHRQPQPVAQQQVLPLHHSDTLPLFTAVIPATRIATPR